MKLIITVKPSQNYNKEEIAAALPNPIMLDIEENTDSGFAELEITEIMIED